MISNICASYFNGFNELRTNSCNGLAWIKVISYFTIIIPVSFAIARSCLKGRVKKVNLNAQDSAIQFLTGIHLRKDHSYLSRVKKEIDQTPSLHALEMQLSNCENPMAHFNSPPFQVIEGLYLGSQRNVGVFPSFEKDTNREGVHKQLIALNITTIITCSGEQIPLESRIEGLTYVHRGIGDSPNNPEFIAKLLPTLQVIHQTRSRGEGVFIHCNAGASRSPSFVIAYLMVLGMTFEEAYRYVKHKRLIVNVGNFEAQLKTLDVEEYRKSLLN